jgi:hypothetical protein
MGQHSAKGLRIHRDMIGATGGSYLLPSEPAGMTYYSILAIFGPDRIEGLCEGFEALLAVALQPSLKRRDITHGLAHTFGQFFLCRAAILPPFPDVGAASARPL